MKSHYQAVVIGGGVVGVSVLYHLTKFGWSDVALIERSVLTAGSTWHAAAGCHMINDDPNIAALQGYTIRLYKEIESESGQSVGMHMTGGLNLAGNAARWEWLKAEQALFQTLGVESHLVSAKEIAELCPFVDVRNVTGGLYDPNEGHLDPHGVTHAYAGAAKKRGAEVILHNRVTALTQRPDGNWDIQTEKGKITAEHVVNAGGLWARKLGRMVGVNLPVVPMQHHYLITEDVPEIAALDRELPAVTDLEGFTYLRQERKGVLLGIYETNPSHWQVEGAPWDFGMDLLPPDIERISPELTFAFERFPFLQKTGIRRWVNGAFTFTPDGNPLVGPVPGLKNYWVACGCMGGFSQGGAIGLSLAQWMIEGDPGADIFGMDVARYGDFAANDKYLTDMTRQFYARRFILAYPNEELPAGRPLKTAPTYDRLKAEGAHFAPLWGMESPLYFAPGQPDFVETPSLRRSNAHDLVGAEVQAVRTAAGIFETSVYARYEITGAGAEAWLDKLLAGKLPNLGKVRLAPMLSPKGNLLGDLSVARVAEDRFWIVGSYHLQVFHSRWFRNHLPESGVVIQNLSDRWMGYALSGPKARSILASLSPGGAALGFMSCGFHEVGNTTALVTRISYSGEQGFEINVPTENLWSLYDQLRQAGADHDLKPYGLRALDCLRLEKSYGGWGTEFAQSYTPGMSGLDRFVAFDKAAFIGRDAALRERDKPGDETLVTLEIEASNADAFGYEPVFLAAERVGYITSGAYGHFVKKSLAFAYLKKSAVLPNARLEVAIIGERKAARVLAEPAYDPKGQRLRA